MTALKTAAPLAALAFLIAACGGDAPETEEPTGVPAAKFETIETTPELSAADLRARIEILASDSFEGRAPGTAGGRKTVEWLEAEYERIGLSPAGVDGYRQAVPLLSATLDARRSSLKVATPDGERTLEYGPQAVYWTKRVQETVAVDTSDLVFVGYGVVAPEYQWNDYKGLDVAGKTVVILVNDPGYAVKEDVFFNGEAMTYYGRWTYKYEEAARQGAAGALIVHETAPAAYPWSVVEGSWTGPQLDLEAPDGGASRAAFEGWISLETAEALFAAAGKDFAAEKKAALTPAFTPAPLEGLSVSAELSTSFSRQTSHNVAGYVAGTDAPDEFVLYMAHWDHLGRSFAGDDTISNGAVDNATGTAAILEIAESFANLGVKPKRSVLFLAVTAEESGLLGSAYYAEDPLVPLADTVAGFNIDAMLPVGPTKDMIVIGSGASELEDLLTIVAKSKGKYLRPDANSEKGYFYRSDHISLAKKGVPMLYADTGIDAVQGGEAAGRAFADAYTAERYHKPADEYDESWNLDGMIEDVEILYETGRRLAFSRQWPNWYEGSEFRALRDAQRPEAE